MMTKLWDPRHVIPRKSAWSLVHRMLIGLLVFGFVLEPVILHAQTGRKGKSSSRKDEAGQRRSARDVYSGASLGAEGVVSGGTDLSLDVLSIGKDAYDAVIRSGRYIVGPSDAFLVVVDGRQPRVSEGVNLRELAQILAGFGAHTAINLDGGGSTTMVIQQPGGKHKVVNRPSDLYPLCIERPVGTHLAVFAEKLRDSE